MTQQPPPEAILIKTARSAAFDGQGMSIRAAAARTRNPQISEGTWRRIESDRDVTRQPKVVAAMAAVVSVTPGQLADAGRPDAAALLSQQRATGGRPSAAAAARPVPWATPEDRAKATAALRRLSDSDKITLLWQVSGFAPAIVLEVLGHEPEAAG